MVGNELVKVSGSPSPMLIWVFNQAANGKIPLFAEPAYSLFCSETIAKYRTISSSARQKAKIKRRISVKWRDERRRKSRDWELTERRRVGQLPQLQRKSSFPSAMADPHLLTYCSY